MTSGTGAGRERVVIVDRDLDFGLKLADCLASSGYHAVLGRSLDAMMDDLGEMQPGAILLSSDPSDQEKADGTETLEAVKALYPDVAVMTLTKPGQERFAARRLQGGNAMTRATPPQFTRVAELLQGKLGIRCAPMF
jgi:DNA-binding NtrC family response regulator